MQRQTQQQAQNAPELFGIIVCRQVYDEPIRCMVIELHGLLGIGCGYLAGDDFATKRACEDLQCDSRVNIVHGPTTKKCGLHAETAARSNSRSEWKIVIHTGGREHAAGIVVFPGSDNEVRCFDAPELRVPITADCKLDDR
jgi:hypothetical protein